MITAVFSDVHANLLALEAFLAVAEPIANGFLCLGDTVNYGPWNDECLERIAALPDIVVLEGNHERLFLGVEAISDEIPLVQQFFEVSSSGFTRVDLISALPTTSRLGRFTCIHTIDERRIFADTDIDIDGDHVIGHSHHQYAVQRGDWMIVNPGSVGQNRKRIDLVEFALHDDATDTFELRSVPYDFGSFLAEVRQRGYPPACLEYYDRKVSESATD